MKVRGAARGAVSAWLGLIVLQVAVSQGGSGKIAGAFDSINSLVQKALDPNVPAIADRSSGATAGAGAAGVAAGAAAGGVSAGIGSRLTGRLPAPAATPPATGSGITPPRYRNFIP